jgi:hypothetical protein
MKADGTAYRLQDVKINPSSFYAVRLFFGRKDYEETI